MSGPALDGIFTVKSTYNHLAYRRPVVPIQGADDKVWKSLWSCKAAHRTKIFVWKCIREIVPTRTRLSRHIPGIERGCGLCEEVAETLEHIIFECAHSKRVWNSLNVDIEAIRMQYDTVKLWVLSWFITAPNHSVTMADSELYVRLIGSWILWKDRCEAIYQGVTPNSASTVRRIKYYLNSCLHSPSQIPGLSTSITSTASRISKWQPPPLGLCKGIKGTFSDGALSAEDGESLAVKEALIWARSKGLESIHIEADAKVVIQAITEGRPTSHWDGKNIIKEIKWLASSFRFCSFGFVSRDDNQVADYISKFVRQSKIYLDMSDLFPIIVSYYLAKDSNFASLS